MSDSSIRNGFGLASWFRGVSIGELALPLVAVVAALGGKLWVDGELANKQDRIVLVDFERLSNLYTYQAIESGASGEALERMTNDYLAAANAAADEFADATHSIVILSAAVVGGEERMHDATDTIHARAMEMVAGHE